MNIVSMDDDKDKENPYALPKEEDKDDGTFNGASAPAWTGSQEIEKEPPPGTDPQKN